MVVAVDVVVALPVDIKDPLSIGCDVQSVLVVFCWPFRLLHELGAVVGIDEGCRIISEGQDFPIGTHVSVPYRSCRLSDRLSKGGECRSPPATKKRNKSKTILFYVQIIFIDGSYLLPPTLCLLPQ